MKILRTYYDNNKKNLEFKYLSINGITSETRFYYQLHALCFTNNNYNIIKFNDEEFKFVKFTDTVLN